MLYKKDTRALTFENFCQLRALIQLHPHSVNVQDKNGNSPLHLAIGSDKADLAAILAHFA